MFDIGEFIKKIRNKQRNIDKRYREEGLTDEILEEQIEVNKMRHELDLPDENEFIYENFVQ